MSWHRPRQWTDRWPPHHTGNGFRPRPEPPAAGQMLRYASRRILAKSAGRPLGRDGHPGVPALGTRPSDVASRRSDNPTDARIAGCSWVDAPAEIPTEFG